MLHLCIPRKDGHEVHVPVNEYTQFIASWIVGAYLTNENRVNRGRRIAAVTKIRTFIKKELSCLKTSV